MRLNKSPQLRQIVLCIAATFLTTQALAVNYQLRLASKGMVAQRTSPVISEIPAWSIVFGTPAFQIPAPGSTSSGAFSYASNAQNVVALAGNWVSLVGVGTTTITATQAADARHSQGSVAISITVLGAAPALSGFTDIAKTFGAGSFTLTAPYSDSPGTIAYSSDNSEVASVSGSTLSVHGAGTATITAIQAASGNYASGSAFATLTVSKAVPTIQPWAIPTKLAGSGTFSIAAPSSSSPEVFSYTSSNVAVATISGTTVSIVGQGTSTITATQAAGANFTAAVKTATLTVSAPPLPSGYFSYNGLTWTPRSAATYTFAGALNYCSGAFNGSTGWHLPSVAEFLPPRDAGLLLGANINTWNNAAYVYSQTVPGTGSGYIAANGNFTFLVYCVK